MTRFGLHAKIMAQPGKRDALVEVLLAAAASLEADSNCELYVVSTSETEPDVIWVMEAWTSHEAHAASLQRAEARALIERGRPFIAGGERVELVPLGGKGLATG